ncbi:MAG: DUF1345 domain-containing protein [Sphingobium sp.]
MSKAATSRFFPWRYGMFLALLGSVVPLLTAMPWHEAVMAGFDIAAIAFITAFAPIVGQSAASMRSAAQVNDANRGLMLLLTGIVSLVILVAVGVAAARPGGPGAAVTALLLVTLALAWVFANLVYAMHYAHIFYLPAGGGDQGGMEFPDTEEPGYWDFLYFAFTLGMTFQTSDVSIGATHMRRAVLTHCLLAFLFNLGILAFTINVLGGSRG